MELFPKTPKPLPNSLKTPMEPLSGQLSLNGVDPLHGREFTVRKRDGRSESFNEERIRLAVESAFKADRDIPSDYNLSPEDQAASLSVTAAVVQRLFSRAIRGEELERACSGCRGRGPHGPGAYPCGPPLHHLSRGPEEGACPAWRS